VAQLTDKVKQAIWMAAGLAMVALGVIGAFLPLMPTTIFLIMAGWCFARSSPRLEAWLLNHPRFGGLLRDWRDYRAIPRRAKIAACAGMVLGFVMFWLGTHPGPLLAVAVAAGLLACAAYVVTRPGRP
jgi:hypothetical protein